MEYIIREIARIELDPLGRKRSQPYCSDQGLLSSSLSSQGVAVVQANNEFLPPNILANIMQVYSFNSTNVWPVHNVFYDLYTGIIVLLPCIVLSVKGYTSLTTL